MREVFETSIKSLPLLGRGKVRDIYAVGDDKLLIVTTDRLSAYDVILPTPVPEKGRVLNELANFWFARLAPIIQNVAGKSHETAVARASAHTSQGDAVSLVVLDPVGCRALYNKGQGQVIVNSAGNRPLRFNGVARLSPSCTLARASSRARRSRVLLTR